LFFLKTINNQILSKDDILIECSKIQSVSCRIHIKPVSQLQESGVFLLFQKCSWFKFWNMISIPRIKSEIIKFIIYKKNFSNVETILLCYKFQGFPVSLPSSPGSGINIQITTSSINFIKFNVSKLLQEIRDHK